MTKYICFSLFFSKKIELETTLLEVQDIPPDTHLHLSRILLPDILVAEYPLITWTITNRYQADIPVPVSVDHWSVEPQLMINMGKNCLIMIDGD